MSPAKRKQTDPLEKAIEAALSPGRFISYNAAWSFVEDVQGVADVRKRHFRKKGFMAGFEDIVAGAPKQVEPSFLERAKARWPRKPKRS